MKKNIKIVLVVLSSIVTGCVTQARMDNAMQREFDKMDNRTPHSAYLEKVYKGAANELAQTQLDFPVNPTLENFTTEFLSKNGKKQESPFDVSFDHNLQGKFTPKGFFSNKVGIMLPVVLADNNLKYQIDIERSKSMHNWLINKVGLKLLSFEESMNLWSNAQANFFNKAAGMSNGGVFSSSVNLFNLSEITSGRPAFKEFNENIINPIRGKAAYLVWPNNRAYFAPVDSVSNPIGVSSSWTTTVKNYSTTATSFGMNFTNAKLSTYSISMIPFSLFNASNKAENVSVTVSRDAVHCSLRTKALTKAILLDTKELMRTQAAHLAKIRAGDYGAQMAAASKGTRAKAIQLNDQLGWNNVVKYCEIAFNQTGLIE